MTPEEQRQALAMKLWLLYMLFEDEAVAREYRETFVDAVKTLPRGEPTDVTMERVNTMLDKLAAKFLTPHHVEVITKKVAAITGAMTNDTDQG